jgi:uncharacterized protein YjbJ (UPF0337 family)
MKGSVKTQWGKLTDDDMDVIAGQKDILVGKIQERYGLTKDAATKQVDDWNPSVGIDDANAQRERDIERQRKAS